MRLLQLLAGDTSIAPPEEWVISRVCEDFHCTPSVAEYELDRDPRLVLLILTMRALAAAKTQVEHTEADKLTMTPMVRLYMELDAALLAEWRATHGG